MAEITVIDAGRNWETGSDIEIDVDCLCQQVREIERHLAASPRRLNIHREALADASDRLVSIMLTLPTGDRNGRA